MMIPMLETVELADAPSVLARFAVDPNLKPIILTVKKKPFAVVLPTEGADVETISVSVNPEFNAMMADARRSADHGPTYSSEEIRKMFGLPPYDPDRARRNGPKGKPKVTKKAAPRKSKASR